MKKYFFFLVFFRMIVRYDYHAIRHFITLYAKDDDLLNLPSILLTAYRRYMICHQLYQ